MIFELNKLIKEKLEKENCEQDIKQFIEKILEIERGMEDMDRKRGYKEKILSALNDFQLNGDRSDEISR